MTLPVQEGNSLILAQIFLRSLLHPKMTPKIPRKIRVEAGSRLKHFPYDTKIKEYIRLKHGDAVADEMMDADEVWN